jgi:hypothetical protein
MKQESEEKEESAQAKEEFSITNHPVIVAAIITTLGAVIVAFVTGGFGLVTKYVETKPNTNLSIQSANSGIFSNTYSNSNQENQSIQITEKVTAKPIPLGTRQTLTLLPPVIGSDEWKFFSCCNNELIFASSEDKSKWVKFKTSGEEHFVSLRITLTDSTNGIDIKSLSTGQVKELENISLETKSFKAVVTPTEVITGDDPDPEKQYPLVFKKVVLSLKVEENKESDDKGKTK